MNQEINWFRIILLCFSCFVLHVPYYKWVLLKWVDFFYLLDVKRACWSWACNFTACSYNPVTQPAIRPAVYKTKKTLISVILQFYWYQKLRKCENILLPKGHIGKRPNKKLVAFGS